MTGRALAVALSLYAAPALGARLFVSTERPFAPGEAGAVVKMEVRGTRSVDVRLYRIADAERFFLAQPDVSRVAPPPDAEARPGHPPEPPARSLGALGRLRRALADAGHDAVRMLRGGLSPAARALASTSAKVPRGAGDRVVPFLAGLDLVERWDLACGAGDEEFAYCDLEIGPRPAGAYLVEAATGRELAYAVALVSRLALVSRTSPGHLALLSADAKTGRAIPGVAVLLLSGGQVVARGVTSRQGLFATKVPAGPLTVLGQRGADVAVLGTDGPTTPAAGLRALVVTDRGEYRLGETVRFHGFVRAGDDRGSVPRGVDVELSAFDARDGLFHRSRHALSQEGGFGGQLHLAAGLPQGLYRLVVALGDQRAGAELLVRDAPLPAFSLDLSLGASRPGAPAVASAIASRDGRALALAQLSWRAVRSPIGDAPRAPEEIDRGDAATDAEGRATFAFATSSALDAIYEVDVVAKDSEGRLAVAHAETRLQRRPVRVQLSTERRLVSPGERVQVAIEAHDAAGAPAETTLKVRVLAARGGPGAEGPRAQVLTESVRTLAGGRASVGFAPATPGYYEIEASQDGVRLAETFLYVTAEGGDIPFTPDSLMLVPDRHGYTVGETARILVLAPFDAADALVTVEGGDRARHEAIAIRGSSAVWSVKVAASMAPDFTLTAQAVSGERTWSVERTVAVLPRAAELSVAVRLEIPSPGEAVADLAVAFADGRPAAGAELFVAVSDAAATGPAAPPASQFFHPRRASAGRTGGTTSTRSSSAGRAPTALLDGASLDGPTPFKALSQGRPRPRDSGTLLAAAATADSSGRARLRFAVPPDLSRLSISTWAAQGDSFGEAGVLHDLPGPRLALSAPPFLRDGDTSIARAWLVGSPLPDGVELVIDGAAANAASTDRASMPLEGRGARRDVTARSRSAGEIERTIPVFPSEAVVSSGVSGVALPGRTRLPDAPPGERTTLHLSAGLAAVAQAAREVMGTNPEPMTAGAVARLLAQLGADRARPRTPGDRHPAQADAAALAGLAFPEGGFGAYDGGPPDAELSAWSLLALGWARRAGVDVESHVLGSTAHGPLLRARGVAPALAAAARAAAGELSSEELERLAAREASADATAQDRALAVLALHGQGDRRARDAADRLEKVARMGAPPACLGAVACDPGAPSRPALKSVALGALALEATLPRSAALAPALRLLLASRERGDFGGDVAGGLAALAVASYGGFRPGRTTVVVESDGRPVAVVQPGATEETAVPLPEAGATLGVTGAPVAWRLAREARASKPALGPLVVERLLRPLLPEGASPDRPLQVGDRVEVRLVVRAAAPTGPVRVDDPYPAGLAPVEQEGERESWRALSDRARRLLWPDRVVFTLPGLKSGETVLVYEAVARFAGRFAAAPVRVDAGEAWGRSGVTWVTIEEASP